MDEELNSKPEIRNSKEIRKSKPLTWRSQNRMRRSTTD